MQSACSGCLQSAGQDKLGHLQAGILKTAKVRPTFLVAMGAPSASAAAAIMPSSNEPRRRLDSLNNRAAA